MTRRPRLPRIRLGWIALAAFVVVVIGAAVYGFVVAPNLYPAVTLPPNATPAQGTAEAARLAAVTTTRASILAALAGVGALITIAINYRNSTISNETFRIAERGQLTDRYAKAIELLGDTESVAIRLGGIYALQQFALDTRRPEDQNTVVEVLSAFVRLNLRPAERRAPTVEPRTLQPTANPRRRVAGIRRPEPVALVANSAPATVDVQAAISVLAHLQNRGGLRADFTGLDFTQVDLTGVRLADADLSHVNLAGAYLKNADLRGANLIGANLSNANLGFANLGNANLSNANLSGTGLRWAYFTGADLTEANLIGADLSFATLVGAILRYADLRGADIANARFGDVNLRGLADLLHADLENAKGLDSWQLTASQRAAARNVPSPRDLTGDAPCES